MKTRRWLVLGLVLCMMLALAVPGSAANDEKGFNVMFVIDGSGSLFSGKNPSDPKNFRYETINMVIDVLPDQGSSMGAIVFAANTTSDTSDAAMESGMLLNTGLMPINSKNDKESLKRQIDNERARSQYNGGATDIGTALLMAQRTLSQIDNGNRSFIFLFTDGQTELDWEATKQKSLANGSVAAEALGSTMTDQDPDNDIEICGVFLNDGGKIRSTEVSDLVSKALGGVPVTGLGQHYVEIQSNLDLPLAADAFSELLFGTSIPDADPVADKHQEYTIRIPGVGVNEANIRIRAADGMDLPVGMDVRIYAPNETQPLNSSQMNAIGAFGRTYQLYKLVSPQSGTWRVTIDLPETSNVSLYYNAILNVYLEAGLDIEPAPADLHVNSTAQFQTYLTRSGQRLTDSASYAEYECSLRTVDTVTGEVVSEEIIVPNGSNVFAGSRVLDSYGVYAVRAAFTCDDVVVVSEEQVLDLRNHAPSCAEARSLSLEYGLGKAGLSQVDLSDSEYRIEDLEDPFEALSFRIVGGTANTDAVKLDGGKLSIDAEKLGSGQLKIEIADTQGATATLTLLVRSGSVTSKVLTGAVIIAVLALAAVIVFIRLIHVVKTEGTCSVMLEIPDQAGHGDTRSVAFTGLNPPGSIYVAKHSDLAQVLGDLSSETSRRKVEDKCKSARLDYTYFKKMFEEMQPELQKVKMGNKIFRDRHTRKLSANCVTVRYGKERAALYSGSHSDLMLDRVNVRVTVSYEVETMEDDYSDPRRRKRNEYLGETAEDRESFTNRPDRRKKNPYLSGDED